MFMCVVNLKSVNKLDLTWKQSFLIIGLSRMLTTRPLKGHTQIKIRPLVIPKTGTVIIRNLKADNHHTEYSLNLKVLSDRKMSATFCIFTVLIFASFQKMQFNSCNKLSHLSLVWLIKVRCYILEDDSSILHYCSTHFFDKFQITVN